LFDRTAFVQLGVQLGNSRPRFVLGSFIFIVVIIIIIEIVKKRDELEEKLFRDPTSFAFAFGHFVTRFYVLARHRLGIGVFSAPSPVPVHIGHVLALLAVQPQSGLLGVPLDFKRDAAPASLDVTVAGLADLNAPMWLSRGYGKFRLPASHYNIVAAVPVTVVTESPRAA
jgi:hypothetical protein